jgi:hypothetical protein
MLLSRRQLELLDSGIMDGRGLFGMVSIRGNINFRPAAKLDLCRVACLRCHRTIYASTELSIGFINCCEKRWSVAISQLSEGNLEFQRDLIEKLSCCQIKSYETRGEIEKLNPPTAVCLRLQTLKIKCVLDIGIKLKIR